MAGIYMVMVEAYDIVVVDTSVLISAYELKKDPFEGLDVKNIYIPGSVIKELERLGKTATKYTVAKRLIFKLLSLYNIIIGKDNGSFADKEILNLVGKYKVFFTNDKILKQEIKKRNGVVYSFSEKGLRKYN